MFPRTTVLTAAIRRDILAVLAESDAMTVPAATALAGRGARAGVARQGRRW